MVDQHLEQESSDAVHTVEHAIASLWEKAREASLLISTLREEKKHLQSKVEGLEDELQHAKNELLLRQSQIEKLKLDGTAKNSAVNLDENEKRQLQQKVRNVISKIDQYLAP